MYIQLLVSVIALLLYLMFASKTHTEYSNRKQNKDTKTYIIIVIGMLILQSALRNVAVGADTYAYFVKFNEIIDTRWDVLIDGFHRTYVEGIGKDPGYGVFVKAAQLISVEYQIFLFIVAIFFFIGLARMFRYMRLDLAGICVAVLVYEVIFYDFFSITGIRQTVATGFFFYAYPFIQKKKIIPYLLIMAVAATIHKSSLILLPFYFLANFKYPKTFLIGSLIALPFLFGIARAFAIYITQFELFESYSMYAISTYETTGAINFTIFLIVIAIFTIVINKNLEMNCQPIRVSINSLSLAIIFVPLTWVDPSLMRVCQYFSVFSMFLLGPVIQYACNKFKINPRHFILLMFLMFTMVILRRGGEYAFFWEDMALPSNYRIGIV